jgi:SAM-dependent methyltransferase
MSKAFGPILQCQSCAARPLTPVVFLGHLPPVSTMYPIDGPAVRESWFPAPVFYCPSCHLVQLGYVEDPAVLFQPEYKYTSGTTKSLRANFAELARQARTRFGLTAKDLMVDIGSNDGTLLSNFQSAGHRVVGIEPTKAGDIAIAAGIPTVQDFLGKGAVDAVVSKHGKAKVVTAANVFGHMPDIDEVMACISSLLEPGGIFISESDYLLDIVNGLEFDTMYHEHLRSIRSIPSRISWNRGDTASFQSSVSAPMAVRSGSMPPVAQPLRATARSKSFLRSSGLRVSTRRHGSRASATASHRQSSRSSSCSPSSSAKGIAFMASARRRGRQRSSIISDSMSACSIACWRFRARRKSAIIFRERESRYLPKASSLKTSRSMRCCCRGTLRTS